MGKIKQHKRIFSILALCLIAAAAAWGEEPRKVTKAEALRAAVSHPAPDYPATAKQLKIQGTVELQATVGESGEVEKVDIVSGNPMLTKPAVDAIRRWKFAPFTADGKAIKALAPISVAFTL